MTRLSLGRVPAASRVAPAPDPARRWTDPLVLLVFAVILVGTIWTVRTLEPGTPGRRARRPDGLDGPRCDRGARHGDHRRAGGHRPRDRSSRRRALSPTDDPPPPRGLLMASAGIAQAGQDGVRTLARAIRDGQTAEIAGMNELLARMGAELETTAVTMPSANPAHGSPDRVDVWRFTPGRGRRWLRWVAAA